MFTTLIYFISALILSVLHTDNNSSYVSIKVSLGCLAVSYIFLFLMSDKAFKKLNTKASYLAAAEFEKYVNIFSIQALVLFAVNIYLIGIPPQFINLWIFEIPTLKALFLMMIFTSFMLIIWERSFYTFKKINDYTISRGDYLKNQAGLAIPSMAPWFFISLAFDFTELLHIEKLSLFLNTAYGQIFYMILLLFAISAFIPFIIKKFWGCKKLEEPETNKILVELSQKTGVSYKEALTWPLFGGKTITAGVIGFIKPFRYILVTPGFCNLLSYDEKEAVLAHEFGHIKKRHIIWYLLILTGFIIASDALIEPVMSLFILFSPASFINLINSYSGISSILTSFTVVIFFIIYFRYIFGYFMRNFEREADGFSAITIGSALPLISTFKKISQMSIEAPDKPNWHHFSILERITYLLEMDKNKSFFRNHEKKVKKNLIVYFIAAIIIVICSNLFMRMENNRFYNKKILAILKEQVKKQPENYLLHHYIGDIMIKSKNHTEAIQAYKKALSIKHDLPETLNNLAWIYITSPDKNINNQKLGLELAQKALKFSNPQPAHILDTLAEGNYRIQKFKTACKYSKEALDKADSNKKYYLEQKKRICGNKF
ncbi:MAG: hypothetical protein CSB21_00730 [Deltaproteobacteria bacterium]|nr:MAG: hypothetical protein CSB21_00730 [Deltaproteobacteria bacterium]